MPPDQSNLNQGTNGPPVSEAVKRLTEQKDQITLRAEIAAQEAKLAAVGLPADGPKGTTAISGDVSAEGLVLAYLGVNSAAAQIADRIRGECAEGPVLIHNPADFSAIAALGACRARMELLEKAMAHALAEGKTALDSIEARSNTAAARAIVAVPAIGAAVASMMQVAALFRADHDLRSTKIDISDRAFIVAVAGAMRKKGIKVYDTAIMPPLSTEPSADSSLCGSMQRLDKQYANVISLMATIDHHLTKTDPTVQMEAEDHQDDKLTAARDKLADSGERYKAFDVAMAKIDDVTSSNRIAQYLDAERLSALIGPKTHFLWLQMTAASGTTDITSRSFGSKVRYSGASVVCYALYDAQSTLVDAGTIPLYSSYCPSLRSIRDEIPAPRDF